MELDFSIWWLSVWLSLEAKRGSKKDAPNKLIDHPVLVVFVEHSFRAKKAPYLGGGHPGENLSFENNAIKSREYSLTESKSVY